MLDNNLILEVHAAVCESPHTTPSSTESDLCCYLGKGLAYRLPPDSVDTAVTNKKVL